MRWIKYLVLLGALYSASTEGLSWWKRYKIEHDLKKHAGNELIYGFPKSCQGKKYCIIVYVTPWSQECKNSLQGFYAIQRFLPRLRPEVGFGFVIGGSKPKELEQLKEQLKEFDTFIDEASFYMKFRKVLEYPTWIIADSQGHEIHRASGPIYASSLGEVNQVLVDLLKL